jgi:hypothetical protein
MGLSESMLDAEAVHVAQEARDHVICSVDDLREKLKTLLDATDKAEEHLQILLRDRVDRERLTARVLIARDMYHLAELYIRHLKNMPEQTGHAELRPEELKEDGEPKPVLQFRESLF